MTESCATPGDWSVWSALLIWARVLPIAMMLPCVGRAPAPPSARLLLAIAVSSLALTVLAASMPAEPMWHAFFSGEPRAGGLLQPAPHLLDMCERVLALDTWQRMLALIREFLVGVIIGFTASLVFWAMHAGFWLMGHALFGFRSERALDSSMSGLGLLLCAAGFFAMDGHIALLRAIAASYRLWPVDQPLSSPGTMLELIQKSARVFEIALSLAAPVLVAVLLAQLALALLARAQPGLRVASSMQPTGLLVGLCMTALAMSGLAMYLAFLLDTMPDLLVVSTGEHD